MAKLNGPLLSVGAHGALAKDLTFFRNRFGNRVRRFHYPHRAPSISQYQIRVLIGMLTAHWQVMSDAEKSTWRTNAGNSGLDITGFNYFIREAYQDLKTHHGLCAYWPMNELTGETVYDISGQGLHGTLEPSYPDNVPSRVSGPGKFYGRALSFDNLDDYVDCGDILNDLELPCSIILWMNWISGTGPTIGSEDSTAQYHGFRLQQQSTGAVAGSYMKGGGITGANRRSKVSVANVVTSGVWTQIGYVLVDIDNIHLYVNAQEVEGEMSGSATFMSTSADHCLIGRRLGASPMGFNGILDDIKVYNREIGPEEMHKQFLIGRNNKRRQYQIIH